MSGLPAAVRAALAERLEGKGRRDLAGSHTALSASYRRGANSAERLRSDDDALAYAVARMPATHAAVAHALRRLAEASPDLAPCSALDAGCGPGTASIAVAAAFHTVTAMTLIDRNAPLLALARTLAPAAAPACAIDIRSEGLDPPPAFQEVDLAVAAYVLVELQEAAGARLALALWRATRQALVLVEPGTPEGFRRLRAIRESLIAEGANVAAPCTHHTGCPMAADDWCRVPVRVERSRDHRALKGGALGHEDEPVAYLAVTRAAPTARASHRIVGPPRRTKAEVSLPVCGLDGISKLNAASRDREKFKVFKRLDWGDTIQNPEAHAVIQPSRSSGPMLAGR